MNNFDFHQSELLHEKTPLFQREDVLPQSCHQDDYSISCNNIKDNVAKHIAAYKADK